uniref:Uncharacterized protein n=1 Tax=Schizophyllum commune (strain H4-8 / FGSC 9210) TaxID=578458 RepID=D8QEJ1_SCHCM
MDMDVSHYPASLGDTRGGGILTSSHPLATHGDTATHDVFFTHAGPSVSAAPVPVIPSATPSTTDGVATTHPLAAEATEITSDDAFSAQQSVHQPTAHQPTAQPAPTVPNANAVPTPSNANAAPNSLRRRGRPLGVGPRAHFEALRVCQNPALLQNGNDAEIELERLRKEREQREIEESHRTLYKYVLENEQRHVKAKSFEASVLEQARLKALKEKEEKLKKEQEKALKVKAKGGKRKVKALSPEEAERKAKEAKERELKRLARTPKRPPPNHGYDTRLKCRWESSGSSSNSIGTMETTASFVDDAMVVDEDGLDSPLTSEDEVARQVEEDRKRFMAAAPAAPAAPPASAPPAPAGRFAGPGLRAAQAARAEAHAANTQAADVNAMDTRPDNGDVPTEPEDDARPGPNGTDPAADVPTEPDDGARTEPDNDEGRTNADEERRTTQYPKWKGWVNLDEARETGLLPYCTLPPEWARAKAFPLQRQKTEPDLGVA